MEKSTYYGLNLVQGSDIVNPLTNDVPNFRKIDEVMHDNSVAGVTLATEVTNGTIHALVRENTECAVIRFIATSDWKLGDSMTVDGVPVTSLLPNGETLPANGYVTNANVMCVLTGNVLTVYVPSEKLVDRNLLTFTNLVQIGCSLDNTLEEVMSALPRFSEIAITLASSTTGAFVDSMPIKGIACEVIIRKGALAERGYAEYKETYESERRYTNSYNYGWAGWKSYVTSDVLLGLKLHEVRTTLTSNGTVYFGSWGDVEKTYILSAMVSEVGNNVWVNANVDGSGSISCQVRANNSGKSQIRIDTTTALIDSPRELKLLIGVLG